MLDQLLLLGSKERINRSPSLSSTLLQRSAIQRASQDQREAFLKKAAELFERAGALAEAGDLSASAALILKGLDQERRAGGVGPQVLQLIKPRS